MGSPNFPGEAPALPPPDAINLEELVGRGDEILGRIVCHADQTEGMVLPGYRFGEGEYDVIGVGDLSRPIGFNRDELEARVARLGYVYAQLVPESEAGQGISESQSDGGSGDPAVDAVLAQIRQLSEQKTGGWTAAEIGVLFKGAFALRAVLDQAEQFDRIIAAQNRHPLEARVRAQAMLARRRIDANHKFARMNDLRYLAVMEAIAAGDDDPAAKGRAAAMAYASGPLGGYQMDFDLDESMERRERVARKRLRDIEERIAERMAAGMPTLADLAPAKPGNTVAARIPAQFDGRTLDDAELARI